MKKTLVAVAAVGALGLAAIPVAEAHDNAGPFIAGAVIGTVLGTVLSHPPVAYVPPPAPVVVPAPAAVVYAPPPVVYRPAPVVYAPAPYVVRRPVVVRAPAWRKHGYGRPVYGWR